MDLVAWASEEAERRLFPLGTRWRHTLGVVQRAKMLAPTAPEDERSTLIAAAYVHDIGYAPELEDTGFHPVDGARWLRDSGHERLARLVAHHSGARFEAEERGLVEALDAFPEERSMVADLLTYCDLTTGPEGQLVTLSDRLAGIDTRYARDSHVSRSMRAAAEPLAAHVRRSEREIDEAGSGPLGRGTSGRREDVFEASLQAVETSRRLLHLWSCSANYGQEVIRNASSDRYVGHDVHGRGGGSAGDGLRDAAASRR
jgi:hypothetical protein